jgi:hypothetical protein
MGNTCEVPFLRIQAKTYTQVPTEEGGIPGMKEPGKTHHPAYRGFYLVNKSPDTRCSGNCRNQRSGSTDFRRNVSIELPVFNDNPGSSRYQVTPISLILDPIPQNRRRYFYNCIVKPFMRIRNAFGCCSNTVGDDDIHLRHNFRSLFPGKKVPGQIIPQDQPKFSFRTVPGTDILDGINGIRNPFPFDFTIIHGKPGVSRDRCGEHVQPVLRTAPNRALLKRRLIGRNEHDPVIPQGAQDRICQYQMAYMYRVKTTP